MFQDKEKAGNKQGLQKQAQLFQLCVKMLNVQIGSYIFAYIDIIAVTVMSSVFWKNVLGKGVSKLF